ncbi:MAG TPA: DUF2922 domain-containing protein [Ureibacillus sp.]|nr:DUF2922 domain-containing protein [Ureibacillus sp.]
MTQVLEMKFDTANGKTLTLTVNEPKENVSAMEVENAMRTIITSNIFHYNGNSLVAINQARLVGRTVSNFEIINNN